MGRDAEIPAKYLAPLKLAKNCIKQGRYIATYHAQVRQIERLVPLPDVLLVIESGYHEKSRDRFDPIHGAWSYSIRGKSSNRRDLRVIISFEGQTDLLIITVVVLGSRVK